MICPQCRSEYREGFMQCADCGVLLVPVEAASQPLITVSPDEMLEDPFCEFWKGDDVRLHAELLQILEEAGVPTKSVERSDRLFNLRPFGAYRIGVPFSMFEKAELAVKAAFDSDTAASEGASWFACRPLLPPE